MSGIGIFYGLERHDFRPTLYLSCSVRLLVTNCRDGREESKKFGDPKGESMSSACDARHALVVKQLHAESHHSTSVLQYVQNPSFAIQYAALKQDCLPCTQLELRMRFVVNACVFHRSPSMRRRHAAANTQTCFYSLCLQSLEHHTSFCCETALPEHAGQYLRADQGTQAEQGVSTGFLPQCFPDSALAQIAALCEFNYCMLF
jgi:hypothetical protein